MTEPRRPSWSVSWEGDWGVIADATNQEKFRVLLKKRPAVNKMQEQAQPNIWADFLFELKNVLCGLGCLRRLCNKIAVSSNQKKHSQLSRCCKRFNYGRKYQKEITDPVL